MAIVYNTNIVRSGLVLHLDAANIKSYSGTGTAWNDLSIVGNNSTLVNGPTFTDANKGSIVFDGTNDYVTVSSGFNFGSDDFAVECMTFFDGSTSGDNLYRNIFLLGTGTTYFQIAKWRSGISNGIFIDYSVTGNRYCITTSANIPSPNIAATVTSPLYDVTNKWSHVVVSVISNVMGLYINGDLIGSVTLTARWNSTLSLNIGRAETDAYFKGRIPVFRIYFKNGLTSSEVKQNFEALRGRYGI